VGDAVALGSALDGDRVSWWVRDSGPGVPEEDAERIFERFQRGDHSRGSEGSGLGLSIVRAVATAHGGEVRLEPGSQQGGATFTVEVPVSARRDPSEV
jgi:signal transduction histidine kinase